MRAFVLSLILAPLLLLIVFQAVIFNLSFYDYYYQSAGLYQNYPPSYLLGSVKNVLLYITRLGDLNTEIFKEIEILHLTDIRNLILSIQISTTGLAVAAFFLFRKWKSVNLLRISQFALLEILLAGLLIYFLFEPIFLKFHILIFPNDFWMLDPQIHLLIVLYPPEFFFRVIIATFSIILTILLISIIYLSWRTKCKKNVIIKSDW